MLVHFALPVANKLVLTSDRVYLCACILPRDLLLRAFRRIAPIGARLRRPLNGAPSALLNGAPSARWSSEFIGHLLSVALDP